VSEFEKLDSANEIQIKTAMKRGVLFIRTFFILSLCFNEIQGFRLNLHEAVLQKGLPLFVLRDAFALIEV
jgi:hypothetical protein